MTAETPNRELKSVEPLGIEGVVQTGVILEAVVVGKLQELHTSARNARVMVFPPSQVDWATQAWGHYHAAMDKAAVEAGLPEPERDADGDVIHWGVNFETGEILGCTP